MSFENEIKDYLDREVETFRKYDIKAISEAMDVIYDAYKREATIYTMGNGGSAATASHMACDFNKGVSMELNKKFHIVSLSDNLATITAYANDVAYDEIFKQQLIGNLKKGDVVLAFSGSGNSHNIVKAAEYVKEVGATLIGFTGYDGGKLHKMADYHVHIPADDMQLAEDGHMIAVHFMMQIFWKRLMAENGKKAVYKVNK